MLASFRHGTKLLHDDEDDFTVVSPLLVLPQFDLRYAHFKQDGGCMKPKRA
jgi:hypothetical protein